MPAPHPVASGPVRPDDAPHPLDAPVRLSDHPTSSSDRPVRPDEPPRPPDTPVCLSDHPANPRNHPVRPRNDPAQYDDLAESWWDPRGGFAMLHWIAAARARLVPAPGARPGALLLDLACGGGLLAPHLPSGYRHVGLDLSAPALREARSHGLTVVRGDVLHLPFADEVADVVVAGEVLEHVTAPDALVAEACRVLRPGGTLVLDSIAATWWGRLSAVTVGERIPAGPPKRLHDPALFLDRDALVQAAAAGGVVLTLSGLRPAATDYLRWLAGRRTDVRMLTTRSTAGLFQAVGVKSAVTAKVRR